MNSSVNRRIFRAEESDDVYVIGGPLRLALAADGPMATVTDLIAGAQRRGEAAVETARDEAEAIMASARTEAGSIHEAARLAGYAAGIQQAEANVAACIDTMRTAARDGLAIRDGVIDDAMPAMARAIAMAARRIVGAAYRDDPSLTNEACIEAVRAAAGQQILSIRVSPDAADSVRATLLDLADYVRPEAGVDIGGCIIDLRHGSIDATLDARLDLMELALRAAGGAG